jgi:monofunctional biosynthetic peptidoglycan transglycosylase
MAWKRSRTRSRRKRSNRRGGWPKIVGAVVLALLLLPGLGVAVYRFVPPPVTPLMLIRAAAGLPIRKHWVPLSAISPNLQRAVMASEDARFCQHHGFDWDAINDAIDENEEGGRLRGASTISQQTSKNLFLWPGRTFIRKGIEAYITVWLEALWPKRRILETYLNIVEWGDGIYGAEEASRHYFGIPASALSRYQAALLAVSLPSPRRSDPAHPSAYLYSRASTINARMNDVPYRAGTVCP